MAQGVVCRSHHVPTVSACHQLCRSLYYFVHLQVVNYNAFHIKYPLKKILYLSTKLMHISTQKFVKLGCLKYAIAAVQEYNFSLTVVNQFYLFLIILDKCFPIFLLKTYLSMYWYTEGTGF